MSIHREYRQSSRDFEVWIHQDIWCSNATKEKRIIILENFTEDLQEWMHSVGYAMNNAWGLRAVSNWLYSIAVLEEASWDTCRKLRYPEPNHRNWPEDFDYFEYKMDVQTMSAFLYKWRLVEDFDRDTRLGQRVFLELPRLLYTYLDLHNCKNGNTIRALVDPSDSDSDSSDGRRRAARKKMNSDTYIQEMREGYHGGSWSKV